MARYIDADKLEKHFIESVSKHNLIINGNDYPVFLADHTLHEIRNAPTADVVEVIHGEWEYDMYCSVCGYLYDTGEYTNAKDYCPNCGAKMDKKEGAKE